MAKELDIVEDKQEVLESEPWIPSVHWKDQALIILDQRLLPHKTEFIQLADIEAVWNAIHALMVRGAPAIGITAAYGLALWASQYDEDNNDQSLDSSQIARFNQKLIAARDYLAGSRPTAVNLFWALDRMVTASKPAETVKEAQYLLLEEAHAIQQEDEEVCRRIGEHGLSLFQDGDTLMTHCNAGGIATARYGTALAPFHLAQERGIKLAAFASETRPVLQGTRLTAWELQKAGVDVTLITDNMAAHVMQTKDIKAVIVGTDRIAANGDVANKIGTLGLAVLAKYFGIPFYVASPLSTIDLSIESGKEIPIEQRSEVEITHIAGVRVAPENIQVYNPAFDVTPNDLVTGIITEKGILHGNYKEGLKQLLSK